MSSMDTAILSSFDRYSTFSFGGRTLSFRTCDGLERYTKVLRWENGFVGILNLEHPECAMVVNKAGELIETNMDAIEQQIVLNLCRKNLQFLEA